MRSGSLRFVACLSNEECCACHFEHYTNIRRRVQSFHFMGLSGLEAFKAFLIALPALKVTMRQCLNNYFIAENVRDSIENFTKVAGHEVVLLFKSVPCIQ